jgi:hypothetical protein
LSVITFQYSFRSCSRFLSRPLFWSVAHIVVTKTMFCAHCSPQRSPNLCKLPSKSLLMMGCKDMIPDNEVLLQSFRTEHSMVDSQ